MSERPHENEQLRVLCLDGGGIRGLATLHQISEIMREVNKDTRSELRPCDVFDVIAGVGVGGWIALLLGHFMMNLEDCMIHYFRLSSPVEPVYGTDRFRGLFKSTHQLANEKLIAQVKEIQRKYSHKDFRPRPPSALRTCFVFAPKARGRVSALHPPSLPEHMFSGDTGVDQDEEGTNTSERLQKIYVPAKDAVIETEVKDTATTTRGIALPPWKAFEATIATHGLFNTCHVEEKTQSGNSLRFFDEGFPRDIRNPAIQVLRETKRLYPNARIATFLSVGTGIPAVADIQNLMRCPMVMRLPTVGRPPKFVSKLMRALLINLDNEVDDKLRTELGYDVYWRKNFDFEKLGVSDIGPSDYYKVSEIAKSMRQSFAPLSIVRLADLVEQLSHPSKVLSGQAEISTFAASRVPGKAGDSVEET